MESPIEGESEGLIDLTKVVSMEVGCCSSCLSSPIGVVVVPEVISICFSPLLVRGKVLFSGMFLLCEMEVGMGEFKRQELVVVGV